MKVTRRFVFVALFVFVGVLLLASSVWGWEAVYTETSVVSGNVVERVLLLTEEGAVRSLGEGTLASWTPEGEIVFVRDGEIHIANKDGRIRSLGIVGSFPTVSRNYMTFNLQRGNRTFTSVVPRVGGELTLLAFGAGYPAISPDERFVVFHDGATGLVVSPIEGGGVQFLVRGEAPMFLPDGRLVFVDDFAQVPEVRIFDLETLVSTLLVSNGYPLSVTENSLVVYAAISRKEVRAVRSDGTMDRRLEGAPRNGTFRIFGAVEDSRAVEPRGKVATTWANLKR
ncbi:hypothetical protein A3A21_03040 [Candidatus Jorgensenbacteria bacterium RIFCSPLOWO2_01_FULL_45_25b]|uniref:SMP-30/Gluconolactonase/LRE-like region domain-containing protein n=1 Tax=Candidatus Jorgensenbacteria bacterium RIFCSPLOWO2_01_FULL_45_25b TaxID=1798471 RepID=A0A1F6BUZ5_9BACT|nr:MAG: hypothetical protein A3A21_03040 [Candidatus Jorgensenbacteria bacterium RIFCSPLOWO2_01_FULL_45_25b]